MANETKLEVGQAARIKVPASNGVIAGQRFDENTGARSLLLEWQEDGETKQRWFSESELEAIPV